MHSLSWAELPSTDDGHDFGQDASPSFDEELGVASVNFKTGRFFYEPLSYIWTSRIRVHWPAYRVLLWGGWIGVMPILPTCQATDLDITDLGVSGLALCFCCWGGVMPIVRLFCDSVGSVLTRNRPLTWSAHCRLPMRETPTLKK